MMHNDGIQHQSAADAISMADQIRGWCAVITKIARADLQARLDNYEAGLSAIEHGVLRHLSGGVSSMAEISQLMGIAPSTLVYVVDGMEKTKLVKRGKDPRDRRREPLRLEKKGAALFDAIPKMDQSSILVKSLQRMPEPRRRELVELLSEFVAGLPGAARLNVRSEPSIAYIPQSGSAPKRSASGNAKAGKKP